MNDMKFAFVQESFVYDYLRPRRNLLASCAEICHRGITCRQKERLPYFKPGGAQKYAL